MNYSFLSRFESTLARVGKKRYVVELSADERKRLVELIQKGKSPAKKQLKHLYPTFWMTRTTRAAFRFRRLRTQFYIFILQHLLDANRCPLRLKRRPY